MDFSPQTVRSAGFKTVKKGYDPSEVDDFKEKVAAAIETAQNQATAMEARARAAVAKLQEVSQQVSTSSPTGASPSTSDEDAETISRTLVLAQRTADNTVAQANADAESITVKARVDATTVIDNARSMADKLLDEARVEGRRSAESERIKAENEVQALLARRDFLLSDVDHLEHHLGAQRERIATRQCRCKISSSACPGASARCDGRCCPRQRIRCSLHHRPRLSRSCSGRRLLNNKTTSMILPMTRQRPTTCPGRPIRTREVRVSAAHGPNSPQTAGTDPKADEENAAMRLDLGSLDVDAATRPSWSQAGDDPLIIGGDELQ